MGARMPRAQGCVKAAAPLALMNRGSVRKRTLRIIFQEQKLGVLTVNFFYLDF